jgi:hypothetical protein
MNWVFREPQRDPNLGAALRQLEREGLPADDSTALQRRISAAAVPRLARLRSASPRWWEWISRWIPVAVPLGVSASLAAGLLATGVEDASSNNGYAVEVGADSTLVIAAFSEAGAGGEWAAHFVTPENGDWLLEQAVTQ